MLSKGEDSEVGEHSAQRANMPGSGSAHLLTPFEALSSVRFSFLAALALYLIIRERAFFACLVKSSFWPSLAGDDDVELAAEKDSAFRRAARWCGT